MRVASYDIVFQEVPGEVTLALNLSGCPCHCPGCHSQHLWQDIGEPLTQELLDGLIARYGSQVTCVGFMGGDQDPAEVLRCACYVKNALPYMGEEHSSIEGPEDIRRTSSGVGLKTAWYSGRPEPPANIAPEALLAAYDYLKLGPYVEALGGLKSETTNQRFYRNEQNEWVECTELFRRHI